MESAPYFAQLAEGPEDGEAFWLRCADGVRIRVGLCNRKGPSGTVLLFPGRTEYIEKYGRIASGLAARGLATLAVDWRGQGIADRLMDDPVTGHVVRFSDYQEDVKAMLAAARELNLPQPYYLLAHSMGGCIGLRALHEGLPVVAACFTGPMWGIAMPAAKRPAAWALSWSGTLMGLGHTYAPGTNSGSYILTDPFENNMLTTDRAMWDYMKAQIIAHPELQLGGPSLRWLHEALRECRALDRMASPHHPAITFLGADERIVDTARIHSRMARWPNGRLEMIDPGEHEVLMESPGTRDNILDTMLAFFETAQTDRAKVALA